jgi:CheY-like chemotaxis protein
LEARADIAVMFTDIQMPGSMDGLKLAHTVRDRWPPIKILVASGRVRLRQSDLPSNSAFLEKPYRGEAVIAQLRSLVDPA